jgi:hypothetical protein
MSEFGYIECPEGEEQGPAIEDVDPYCVPADQAVPGDPVIVLPVQPVVQEVGLLIYQKLDLTLAPSWPNSGTQTFIAAQPGADWFTSFPGVLPAHVCGDGWAVQQDAIEHDGNFVWPLTITYPDNVLSKAGVLNDAIHQDLSVLIDVPECVAPTPEPTPTMPVRVQPVPVRELAETGPVDPLTVLLFGGIVLLAGVATWLTRWK